MKRLFTIIAAVLLTATIWAQSPQKMSYQAVIRNSSDQLVTNHAAGMQISILQGSATGTPVYVETQTPTSNANGLVTIEIGDGTPVTGTFAGINWSAGTYFIKTETDPTGGTSYTITGTSQLLSVPYALHAKTVASYPETDPTVKAINGIVKSNGTTISAATAGTDYLTPTGSAALLTDFPLLNQNTTGNAATATTAGTVTTAAQPAITLVGTLTGLTVSGTTTVITPVNATDAANKAYVDALMDKILQLQAELGVTDVDGNTYEAVKIGKQVWMSENLKTTKYNDGTAIPLVTDNTAWAALTTGAYSDYSNTPANSTTYGRLYNWYAVDNNAATKVASNGGKNVCPTGWHIPTDDEWTTLTDYLTNNGYGYEGSGIDIAKSMAATSGWTEYGTLGTVGNDQASNNSSGFTALPSGSRLYNGTFLNVGYEDYWWSSTEYSVSNAYSRYMYNYLSNVGRSYGDEQAGFSVRCLRD
ncbi:MAG TPA: fibrobacter succinogenes major paralogous domain-containing protein [Bacteroidales bacterium]|nr:fibrobacter succinogenes major paralogous domain-containing protein [Bacteroidales bacterium]